MKLHPDLKKYYDSNPESHYCGVLSHPFIFCRALSDIEILRANTTYIKVKMKFEEELQNGNITKALKLTEKWHYLDILEMYEGLFTEIQIKEILKEAWNHFVDPVFKHCKFDPRWFKIFKKYPLESFMPEEYLLSEKYINNDIDWLKAQKKRRSAI